MARPMMAGFGERRVEHAVAAERALQAVRDLEDATLARHASTAHPARAAVGDVLAEHDDARVARHLVFQRAIDRGRPSCPACPPALASVAKAADVGSTSGENT